jgi:hypothetical protein
MQEYCEGSVGQFVSVHYNGNVETSMQGYGKSGVVLFITFHYNGQVEASVEAYSKGSVGPYRGTLKWLIRGLYSRLYIHDVGRLISVHCNG